MYTIRNSTGLSMHDQFEKGRFSVLGEKSFQRAAERMRGHPVVSYIVYYTT